MTRRQIDFSQPEIYIDEDTELLGLFVGKNADELTSSIRFIHRKPGVHSNIHIKAVLWDQAKFQMNGDLVVETGAKGVDTYLKVDVLMLSPDAQAQAIPSLEISEDDVRGGHGATISPLDPEQLFYLTSRGLSHLEAQQVLVDGFIREIAEKL